MPEIREEIKVNHKVIEITAGFDDLEDKVTEEDIGRDGHSQIYLVHPDRVTARDHSIRRQIDENELRGVVTEREALNLVGYKQGRQNGATDLIGDYQIFWNGRLYVATVSGMKGISGSQYGILTKFAPYKGK